MAKALPRSAKAVIDDALKSNEGRETICYGIIVAVVVAGLFAFVTGIIKEWPAVVIGGAAFTGWFWPALHYASQMRTENIRIRLHEIPLSMCDSTEEALRIVAEAVGRTNRGGPQVEKSP